MSENKLNITKMETKHTKEYAEKLALEKYAIIEGFENIVKDSTNEIKRNSFIEGYMEAIKQTAAHELLEACKTAYDKAIVNGRIDSKTIGVLINAIKKATE